MKKKLEVTIGIPAYNEQENIKSLVKSLLSQKLHPFKLKEVIVVDDCSSDNTAKVLNSIKSGKLRVLKNSTRQGQQITQNTILRKAKGDLIVLVEADIKLAGKNTIKKLITPFLNRKDIVVCGNAKTLPATNFYEKILVFGHYFKKNIFNSHLEGVNVYKFGGHASKAFTKDYANSLTWPKHVPEDAYFYFSALEKNMNLVEVKDAVFYFSNVRTFKDRIKQCSKFHSGMNTLKKYFDSEMVKTNYSIPKNLVVKVILKSFAKNPVMTFLYLSEALINRIFTARKKNFNALYIPYYTSKSLY